MSRLREVHQSNQLLEKDNLACWNIELGNIRQPHLIGLIRMKISLYKVWDSRRNLSDIRIIFLFPLTNNVQILLPHNSSNNLLRDNNTLPFQSTVNTSVTIALIPLGKFLLHTFAKALVFIWRMEDMILITVTAFGNF